MSSNIVGCFDNPADARAVQQELMSAGFDADDVHLVGEESRRSSSSSSSSSSSEDRGLWESIKEAFGFADERDRTSYTEAARRGSVIVSVDSPDTAIDQAVTIMQRHNVVDLDQREAQWRQQGWAGVASADQMDTSASARTGEEVVPVIEEEVRIGKRQVEAGGVRVYSRVTEQPVEEQVNLRQERVSVERRPVDRPITDRDRPFQEKAIEATETREEAVVDKRARVVEEVAVKKDVEQQTETVRDTVRKTDVEVERLPGQQQQQQQRRKDETRR
jgi:uncharacterized protein (TIGR02271 family)